MSDTFDRADPQPSGIHLALPSRYWEVTSSSSSWEDTRNLIAAVHFLLREIVERLRSSESPDDISLFWPLLTKCQAMFRDNHPHVPVVRAERQTPDDFPECNGVDELREVLREMGEIDCCHFNVAWPPPPVRANPGEFQHLEDVWEEMYSVDLFDLHTSVREYFTFFMASEIDGTKTGDMASVRENFRRMAVILDGWARCLEAWLQERRATFLLLPQGNATNRQRPQEGNRPRLSIDQSQDSSSAPATTSSAPVTSDHPTSTLDDQAANSIMDREGSPHLVNHPATSAGATALKQPSKQDFDVYRYSLATGMKQTTMANDQKLMTLLSKRLSQGQISRCLSRVNKWIKAGNILPDLPKETTKPSAMDPERIDLGENQEGRTPRQRNRNNED